MTSLIDCNSIVRRVRLALFSLLLACAAPGYAQNQAEPVGAGDAQSVAEALKQASKLYGERDYAAAAEIYRQVSETGDTEQAAWALELYAVCLEKLGRREEALAVYEQWLQRYAGSEGEVRVQQRKNALLTAAAAPRASGRHATGSDDVLVYGNASLMYRGMRREIKDGDSDTPISSLAADVDLSLRATTGDFLWRGRVSGGYLQDQSDRDDSQGRVRNLYFEVIHEPTGAELKLGRQRTSKNGIYGYLDGGSVAYPVMENLTLRFLAGGLADSSRDSPSSDHKVYSLAAEYEMPGPQVRLSLYGMEQEFQGVTERRAIGGEVSWFGESSHYLFVADYDIEFKEANNLMFNGNWNFGADTSLGLTLGQQRSPFLSASNALIGEYDLDLDELLLRLDSDEDIYDAALDRTALSRYASVVLNQRLTERLRLVGDVFYFELTDLPQYDPDFDSPDSDANTTLGLQFVIDEALLRNDVLSLGARYTMGDFSDSAVLYLDERLRLGDGVDLTLRLMGTQRTPEGGGRDSFTIRPGVRVDWYITRDLLLDFEAGYEYLQQDFGATDLEVQQAFVLLGVHRRF